MPLKNITGAIISRTYSNSNADAVALLAKPTHKFSFSLFRACLTQSTVKEYYESGTQIEAEESTHVTFISLSNILHGMETVIQDSSLTPSAKGAFRLYKNLFTKQELP